MGIEKIRRPVLGCDGSKQGILNVGGGVIVDASQTIMVTEAMLAGGVTLVSTYSGDGVLIDIPANLTGMGSLRIVRCESQVEVVGAAVTLKSKNDWNIIATQYESVTLVPAGSNVFYLTGDLSASN